MFIKQIEEVPMGMDKYEISGRSQSGLVRNSVYAVAFWFVTITFIFMSFYGEMDITFALIDLFFLVLSILVTYQVFQNLKIKTVTLDEDGIYYEIGEKTKWSFKWIEIQTLMSDSFSGKAPRIGFTLKVNDKWHSVNNRDDLGNKEQLKEAFRFGVKRSLPLGVKIVDANGWAQDIFTEDTLEKGKEYFQKFKGKWNNSKKPAQISKELMKYFGGGLFLISLILFAIGLLIDEINFLAWIFFVIGILFSIIFYYNLRVTLTEIWFDDEGIKMRFFSKPEMRLGWKNVLNVTAINETGYITIVSDNIGGGSGGGFPEEVCEAIKYIYALKLKRDKK
jgi:hypothetical protein